MDSASVVPFPPAAAAGDAGPPPPRGAFGELQAIPVRRSASGSEPRPAAGGQHLVDVNDDEVEAARPAQPPSPHLKSFPKPPATAPAGLPRMGSVRVSVSRLGKRHDEADPKQRAKLARYKALLKEVDRNGDGEIDQEELVDLIAKVIEEEGRAALYRGFAFIMLGFAVLVIGAVFGLSFAVMNLTKEVSTANGRLLDKQGNTVTTYTGAPVLTFKSASVAAASGRRQLLQSAQGADVPHDLSALNGTESGRFCAQSLVRGEDGVSMQVKEMCLTAVTAAAPAASRRGLLGVSTPPAGPTPSPRPAPTPQGLKEKGNGPPVTVTTTVKQVASNTGGRGSGPNGSTGGQQQGGNNKGSSQGKNARHDRGLFEFEAPDGLSGPERALLQAEAEAQQASAADQTCDFECADATLKSCKMVQCY